MKKTNGFTLIELLAVMSIMGIMMFLAVGSFTSWSRGTGMRASLMGVTTGLTQARQWAITRRVPTRFEYGNNIYSNGYYVLRQINDNDTVSTVGNTNLLARGIRFDMESGSVTSEVVFKVDGTCDWTTTSTEYGFYADKNIVLVENRGAYSMMATTKVYRLTGHVRTGRR